MRRHSYVAARLLHLAVAVLSTGPSLAQTLLPPVLVTAPPGGSAEGSLELERAAAISSRLGLKLKELPAAVEIIPGEVMRQRGDLTAQEAVTRATGITAAGTPGDGSSALVSRGFAGHNSTTQLYDGTRLYSAAFTQTFPVDTWLLDRVEVLRGPASVLHGVGATLRRPGVLLGVHTCASLAPGSDAIAAVCQVRPDIIAFDAYQGLEAFCTDPTAQDFLRTGGRVAWGLVPTWPHLDQVEPDGLFGRWLDAVTGVMAVDAVARQSLITATCGLGLLPEPAVASAFHLAHQLAGRIAQVARATA